MVSVLQPLQRNQGYYLASIREDKCPAQFLALRKVSLGSKERGHFKVIRFRFVILSETMYLG